MNRLVTRSRGRSPEKVGMLPKGLKSRTLNRSESRSLTEEIVRKSLGREDACVFRGEPECPLGLGGMDERQLTTTDRSSKAVNRKL